jgi:transposase
MRFERALRCEQVIRYRKDHPDGYGYSRYAGLYRDWLGKTDVRMLQNHKADDDIFINTQGNKCRELR